MQLTQDERREWIQAVRVLLNDITGEVFTEFMIDSVINTVYAKMYSEIPFRVTAMIACAVGDDQFGAKMGEILSSEGELCQKTQR